MLNATLKLLLVLQISQQLLKIFWQSGILPGRILCAEFYTHWNYFFFRNVTYKKILFIIKKHSFHVHPALKSRIINLTFSEPA